MCIFDYGQNKGIKRIAHLEFVIFVMFCLYLEGKTETKVIAHYKIKFYNASKICNKSQDPKYIYKKILPFLILSPI